jgi:hypothetical protein
MIGWICWLLPHRLFSQGTEKPPGWYEEISLNAFVSSSYSYNFNKPETMENWYRVFDRDDNTMKLDVVELSISRKAVNPGDAGFRADIMAGSSIPRLTKASGLDIGDLDLPQVFVTYIAPLGNGLRLVAGKFVTSMGYEVIESYDGHNDNYSHSFLFGYAIPFTHTGVKASYSFSSFVSGMFMLVNGWDNAVDNNAAKSVCAQIGIVPLDGMNLNVNYMAGAEKWKNTSDKRAVLDIVGTYRINSLVTAGMNFDYGTEEHSTFSGNTAEWVGAAGYLRLNVTENASLSIRAEMFNDRDGFRTGTEQQLQEITFTPEYRPITHLVVRGDLRFDKSDKDVFQKENVLTQDQTTVGVNLLYVY